MTAPKRSQQLAGVVFVPAKTAAIAEGLRLEADGVFAATQERWLRVLGQAGVFIDSLLKGEGRYSGQEFGKGLHPLPQWLGAIKALQGDLERNSPHDERLPDVQRCVNECEILVQRDGQDSKYPSSHFFEGMARSAATLAVAQWVADTARALNIPDENSACLRDLPFPVEPLVAMRAADDHSVAYIANELETLAKDLRQLSDLARLHPDIPVAESAPLTEYATRCSEGAAGLGIPPEGPASGLLPETHREVEQLLGDLAVESFDRRQHPASTVRYLVKAFQADSEHATSHSIMNTVLAHPELVSHISEKCNDAGGPGLAAWELFEAALLVADSQRRVVEMEATEPGAAMRVADVIGSVGPIQPGPGRDSSQFRRGGGGGVRRPDTPKRRRG